MRKKLQARFPNFRQAVLHNNNNPIPQLWVWLCGSIQQKCESPSSRTEQGFLWAQDSLLLCHDLADHAHPNPSCTLYERTHQKIYVCINYKPKNMCSIFQSSVFYERKYISSQKISHFFHLKFSSLINNDLRENDLFIREIRYQIVK